MESDVNDSSPRPSQGSTSSSPGMATTTNNDSTEQCDSTSASLEDNLVTVPPVTVENDLGCLLVEVNGSWDKLQTTTQKLSDSKKYSYLSHHFKPSANDALQSHPVTKSGKTWNVTFQLRWLEEFPWLSYSSVVTGGICRNCIFFPEQPGKGEGPGNNSHRSGLLVLYSYQKPYSKPLGKTGVLVRHGNTLMHQRPTQDQD